MKKSSNNFISRTWHFFEIAIAITIITAVIIYLIHPDLHSVVKSASNAYPNEIENKSGFTLFIQYILNNGFKVPLQMFIFALIPIPFLYLINVFYTSLLPGLLYGVAYTLAFQKGFAITIGSMPHFLSETFAFCLFASAVYPINLWIRDKIFHRENNSTFWFEIKLFLKRYILYVLPLIILAAFLETYVADWITNLMI
ncbi:stage II sporulation protein M [Companilactobacillus metriopterae]|uniref:stage II sporulation protein M n=1 Tax=Companilactobacillus metriopterae TaxID=1909267 RepID=UPI00100BD930|nr:stage II sporulation protein M [Companilactobacillus metriopterae]